MLPGDAEHGERGRRDAGDEGGHRYQLCIDTCNGTSWGTIKRYMKRTRADVLLCQEHHLPPSAIAAASQWANRRGWQTVWAPAEPGEGSGWKGGVCVCARKPVALSVPKHGGTIVHAARAVAAVAEAPGYRPITLYAAYLRDGEGLSRANLEIMAAVGRHVARQGPGAPFVLGADFQVSPEAVAVAGLAERMGAIIAASGCQRGTCRTSRGKSEIDFFMVEKGLAKGMRSIATVEATCIRTHVPVRLTFHERLTSARALVVRKPPPLPAERVYGPIPPAPSWAHEKAWVEDLMARAAEGDRGEILRELEALLEQWSDRAEDELEGVTGTTVLKKGLRGREPKLVWRSIIPEKRKEPEGEEADAFRWMATMANELRNIGHVLPRPEHDAARQRDRDDDHRDGSDDDAVHDADEELDELLWRGDLTAAAGRTIDAITELEDPPEPVAACAGTRHDGSSGDANRASNVMASLTDAARALGHILTDDTWARGQQNDLRNISERICSWDDELQRIIEEVSDLADQADAERQRVERAEWAAWVRSNIDSGARNAHRFLQLPTEWQPTTALSIDNVVTADPLRLLEDYTVKYQNFWDGDDPDDEYVEDLEGWARRSHMGRPEVEALRTASAHFKLETTVAYDGFHPRHYSLLCDDALRVVGDMFVVFELVGALPKQLRLLAMPMIPKARKGHRAIAAFVSFYRLWAKVRKPYVDAWQAANDRPYLAAGKGRAPADIVWRQAVRAETSVAARDGAAGTLLWDMSSFFERINRRKLRRRLVMLEFPLPLARLALAAYAGPRVLSMAGAVSQVLYAWTGVAAGCGLAGAFIQAYVVPPFDHMVLDIRSNFGDRLRFTGYIDDLGLGATGTPMEVEHALKEGSIILGDVVSNELDCHIEVAKAAVVASSRELAKRLVKTIGKMAGPLRTAAQNLGIDYAPGRRRSAHNKGSKRVARYRGLMKKMRPFRKLCRVIGAKSSKVFVAGPLPYAVYGAAVNGVTDSEALKLRRTMAIAWSPRARGRSLQLITLLNRAPTHVAENAIILQYCREVWRASLLGPSQPKHGELTLAELSAAWRAVKPDELFDANSGRRKWGESRGPIGNMIMAVNRVGWRMESPYIMIDDFGEEVSLTTHSPALVGQMLHAATLRQLERRIGDKLHRDGASEFAGRRACVDHVRARLQGDKSMTAADKAVFRSVLCGALMTCSRANQLGYIIDDLCPKCGKRGDTVFHRTWACQDEEVVAARDKVAPRWLQEEALRRGPTEAIYTKALFPNPADIFPRPARTADLHVYIARDGCELEAGKTDDAAYEEVVKRVDGWQPDIEELATSFTSTAAEETPLEQRISAAGNIRMAGRLYVDGSCTQNIFTELRRAAAAMVVRQPYGPIEARMLLPIWCPLPQSPQSAEYVAPIALHKFIVGPTVVVSDCMNVVSDFARAAGDAMAAKRRYSGLMKHVWANEARRCTTVIKTKAHRAVAGTPHGAEREDLVGNAAADRAAKEAVKLHPQPTPSQIQDLEAACRRATLVMRTIAATVGLFPPMPRDRMVRHPANRAGAQVEGSGGHQWVYQQNLWRCTRCLKCTVKPQIDAKTAHERCKGIGPNHLLPAIAEKGHDVVYTGGQLPIVFCARCGAFSWRRAYGLAAVCSRRPTGAGQQALARLRRGLVPWINAKEKHMPRRTIDVAGGGIWSQAARRTQDFCSAAATRMEDGNRRQHGVQDDCQDATTHDIYAHGSVFHRGDADDAGDVRHRDAHDEVRGERHAERAKRARLQDGDNEATWATVMCGSGQADDARHGYEEINRDQAGEDMTCDASMRYGTRLETRAGLHMCGRVDVDHDEYGDEDDVFNHGGDLDQPTDDLRRPGGEAVNNAERADAGVPVVAMTARADPMDDVGGKGDATSDGAVVESGAVEAAVAKGVACNAYGACAGPGGPRLIHATAEVAARREATVTTAVVALSREVAILPKEHDARKASEAERGEATAGPPSGAAAPLDGSRCTREIMPDVHPPHTWHTRLGVGPSSGSEETQGDGIDPAKKANARRRDGTVAPLKVETVARGGGDATVDLGVEQPEAGSSLSASNARNEYNGQDMDRQNVEGGCVVRRDGHEYVYAATGRDGIEQSQCTERSPLRANRHEKVGADECAARGKRRRMEHTTAAARESADMMTTSAAAEADGRHTGGRRGGRTEEAWRAQCTAAAEPPEETAEGEMSSEESRKHPERGGGDGDGTCIKEAAARSSGDRELWVPRGIQGRHRDADHRDHEGCHRRHDQDALIVDAQRVDHECHRDVGRASVTVEASRRRGEPIGPHRRQCGSQGSGGSARSKLAIGGCDNTQSFVDDSSKYVDGGVGSDGKGTGRGNSVRVPSRRRDQFAQARPADAHGPERDDGAGGFHRREGRAEQASGSASTTGVGQKVTNITGGNAAQRDADVPIWMRPPSWLYLPHLYPSWTPRGAAECGRHGADDGEASQERADERPISGRGLSLGAQPTDAATDIVQDGADASAAIRGPIEGLGPRDADADSRSRAQRRLDARNAHLQRSLEAHAERVARKRTQTEYRGGEATAADRLEAIRRRLAARISARGLDGHGNTAAAVPEAGISPSVVSAAGRIELRHQIHLESVGMRIRDDPACSGGGGEAARVVQCGTLVGGADGAGAGAGRPAMSSDTAHEASRVAWHDVALLTDRQR